MRRICGRRSRTPYRMALITGASRGIGRAFAEVLPESTGLLLVGRDAGRLEAVRARLARPGREVVALPADLATDEGSARVIEVAERHAIDLLINNAGGGRLGPLLEHTAAEERAVVELNAVTPLVLTHALLPGMLARAATGEHRAGLIIVASEAAFAPLPYFASYAATKAFDLVLAESLAEELRGEPVDVLALCPGATRTAFAQSAGFAAASLPGAADPQAVAREALDALGRHRVLVSGRVRRAATAPLVLPRRLAARGLGAMMSLAMRWRAQAPDAGGPEAAGDGAGARPPEDPGARPGRAASRRPGRA